MKTINNWKPEVSSLLKALVGAGFTLLSGDNGERFKYKGELTPFIMDLIACDESLLFVRSPDGKELGLYLVLGNSPGELVADCNYHDLLDKVTNEHYAKWEGRAQPTIEQYDCDEKKA